MSDPNHGPGFAHLVELMRVSRAIDAANDALRHIAADMVNNPEPGQETGPVTGVVALALPVEGDRLERACQAFGGLMNTSWAAAAEWERDGVREGLARAIAALTEPLRSPHPRMPRYVMAPPAPGAHDNPPG